MSKQNFTILDGAMGTMLHAAGLDPALPSDSWNLSHPEKLTEIQKQYVASGSQVLFANTFCSNRLSLRRSGRSVEAVIAGGIAAAKKAAEGRAVRVALDIGPIGQLIEPLGSLSFDGAYELFREMAMAGEKAGAQLAVIETMSDLYEAKAAVLAVRENTNLPVWVSMTFDAQGRTYLGVSVEAMALTMQALGVQALGFNCCLGPGELLPLVQTLSEWTDLPIILKPNAGLPDPDTGLYTVTAQEFAADVRRAAAYGACLLGGCCGTSPAFIAALAEAVRDMPAATPPRAFRDGICSASRCVQPGPELRYSPVIDCGTDTDISEAVGDSLDDGADIICLRVDEPGCAAAAVRETQMLCACPLQLLSSNPDALENALRAVNGRAMVRAPAGGLSEELRRICAKYGAFLPC